MSKTPYRVVDAFVEWAKACLDEMAANAKVLGSSLDKLDASVCAQAEQAIAQVNQWIAEGQAQIKDVQAKGEAANAGPCLTTAVIEVANAVAVDTETIR